MNERIRELAEQAEEYSYVEYSKKLTGYDREYFFRSKFAELIVLECMDIVDETVTGMVGVNAMENIAKHFGVK